MVSANKMFEWKGSKFQYITLDFKLPKAALRRFCVKKMYWKILENSVENTYGLIWVKLQAERLQLY